MWQFKKSHNAAKRTVCDGHNFPSHLERDVYLLLKRKQELGLIEDLELQPRFKLMIGDRLVTTYVADFRHKERGRVVVTEAKGRMTRDAEIKLKLFAALNPTVKLDILRAAGRGLFSVESLNP